MPVKEASKLVGYSQQYLRRLLRQEKLGGIKVGQVWLVDKGDLDVYLEQAQNVTDQRFGPFKNSPLRMLQMPPNLCFDKSQGMLYTDMQSIAVY